MARGPSIAKILDARNLKAVKYRFDVKAEHKWEPPVKEPKAVVAPVKRVETWNPHESWMD